METFYKLQIDITDKITKGHLNYKKSPKDRITKSYVETRLEALETQWMSFIDVHRQIITEVSEDDLKKSNYNKNFVYDTTEDKYINYKTDLKQTLAELTKNITETKPPTETREDVKSNNFKLPKICIPKFAGNYSEWITFRDLYVSLIHNNTTLDDVQKLHYLKSQLIGEAEQLLRHIPISSSNYASCWKKLEDRYNNKRYLSNNIFKRLFGQKVLQAESASGIKDLLDTTCDCLNGLDNLGICTKGWDAIVIFLISQKLDAESRKQWEAKASESFMELPSLDSFKEFLDHKFKSLEFLDTKQKCYRNVNVHNVDLDSPNNMQSVSILHSNPYFMCPLCKGEHKLMNCKEFVKEDYISRHNFVQTNKLCFNCLGSNHSVYICSNTSRCRVCKRKHHSLLHPPNINQFKSNDNSVPSTSKDVLSTATEVQDVESTETIVTTCFSNISSQVLLATALTKAESRTGNDITLRCLLDQGSQASFVTESAVQTLGLKKTPNSIFISGIGSTGSYSITSKYSVVLKLKSIHDPMSVVEVKAHVLNKLTKFLPSSKLSLHSWPRLLEVKLADPKFNTPNKIDVLLGADIYSEILEEGMIKGPPGTPMAQNTKFGWILSGRVQVGKISELQSKGNIISMHVETEENMNELLKQFWEIEEDKLLCRENKILSPEEKMCEERFKSTTIRDESGRYIVRLPFRDADPECKYGDSLEIATRSLNNLDRRLSKNADLKKRYTDVIEEYVELGHAELIPIEEQNDKFAVYLPHHAVVREDKATTKLRVVFNASAPGKNGVSLNDTMMVGPTLQPDLRYILMRWRKHHICIIADIIKMYRQVKVAQEDINFQRFLWRDKLGILHHYRLLRVTFGTASAPYLAVRVMQQVAYDEGEGFEDMMMERKRVDAGRKVSKDVAEKVLRDFYMDDLMTGCSTVDEGLTLHNGIKEILKRGGFELQKWISNSKELMEMIGEESTEQNKGKPIELGLRQQTDGIRKVLGITWNQETDEIEYSVQLSEVSHPVTKRKMISNISKLFDPLGWISPVIIRAKIFIQKLWLSGIDWDDKVPTDLLQEWLLYHQDLVNLTIFRMPRWIHTSPQDCEIELHGFSDASNNAYAAVVYIRTKDIDEKVHVSLLTSKTKVAPVKQISVPRLELCGAVLLARLLSEVSQTLEIPNIHVHAWTDSTVVLAWLSSHPSRWKTFVGNRVSEIISLYNRKHWSHVSSQDNPADCASRGIKPSEIANLKLWMFGPTWLNKSQIKYSPLVEFSQVTADIIRLEEKQTLQVSCVAAENDMKIFSKFSTLSKTLRVLTYCRRFIALKCSAVKPKFSAWLTHAELQYTLMVCIRKYQLHFFSSEIQDIIQRKHVSKQSKLSPLSPFLDEENILRVGGRLKQADLSFNRKHPILIPTGSHLADIIIADAHMKTLHGGLQSVINYIRTKYWMIRLKSHVRQYERNCVVCIRHNAKPSHPVMGQLPSSRVTASRPFKNSGVDYAGPIAVRSSKGRGHHATKGYICLFVCMATRAIHLEAVSDMTSAGFLAAFKRFVARRGHCASLWSDNGSNFIGAARELKVLSIKEKLSVHKEIAEWLESNGTSWHMIPPHAPNFGGLWEAGVKSTKFHLKRIIGTSTLTFEELTTVLTQIEACLNSRPISVLSENVDDSVPLTPGHFLVGEPLLLVPDTCYEKSNVNSLKRWQLTQRMVQDFWRRWSQEYLSRFLYQYKWNSKIPEPNIGDVVIVMEDDLPPARWLYGIIKDKHPGVDKVTRVVTLRCKGSVIKRPMSKICILPILNDKE